MSSASGPKSSGSRVKRLSASDYNHFLDAAKFARGRALRTGESSAVYQQSQTIVQLANSTGGSLSKSSIVGIGDAVVTPATSTDKFREEISLHGVTPAAGTHENRFAILQEDCVSGGVCDAAVAGIASCIVNVIDANHQFATITDGDTSMLTSGVSGNAQIIYKPSGTGQKWCYVRFPVAPDATPITYVRIDTGETLTPGSLCYGRRVQYTIDAGWEDVDEPGVQVVVSNQFQDVIENDETTGYAAGDVFAITGEIVPTYFDANLTTDSAPGGYDLSEGGYTTIGPFGLRRYAKVTETASPGLPAIPVGSSGEVTIYYGGTAGGVDEPIVTSPAITVQAAVLEWNQTRGAAEDEKVVIVWQQDQNRWVIEFLDSPRMVFFELTEDRDITGAEEELTATVNLAIGENYAENDEITVWFREGEFPLAKNAAVGKAVRDPITGKFWAVHCNQQATMFTATAATSFGVGDGTVSLSSVTPITPHPFNQNTTHTVARNYLPLAGMASDKLICAWNHDQKSLSLIAATPHAFSPVLSLQLNANKTYLQGWTPTLYGYGNVTLGGWNNLISVGTCTLA